jgi:trans-2-enoyl-CoA reductase
VAADGTFHQTVNLGGQGRQQCNHALRARLFDADGKARVVVMNSGVTRANADGSAPGCR